MKFFTTFQLILISITATKYAMALRSQRAVSKQNVVNM